MTPSELHGALRATCCSATFCYHPRIPNMSKQEKNHWTWTAVPVRNVGWGFPGHGIRRRICRAGAPSRARAGSPLAHAATRSMSPHKHPNISTGVALNRTTSQKQKKMMKLQAKLVSQWPESQARGSQGQFSFEFVRPMQPH